ncbi:MAG: MgtC/SapB family protein [Thermomicrobiales bacterium]|nr:MgtC/SapB family protein [Thermomicrobiales bacterium]
MFIGLERERRGKDAGVRTFALIGLLGGMGGLLGETFSLAMLALLGLLVALLNVGSLRASGVTELTTSVAMLVVGFTGILAGLGHTLTPAAVAVATSALLAWKGPLAEFSLDLSEEELRAAVLLAILAVVVYPALPDDGIDPWGLIDAREAWGTVVLIAAIGSINYVLLKLYGARGMAFSGFLGGLINSTVTATEMIGRARDTPADAEIGRAAYQAILLSRAASLLRNGVLVALLAPAALLATVPPLAAMLAVCLAPLVFDRRPTGPERPGEAPQLKLEAPFSLRAALQFGLIFLVLQVVGDLAQRALGSVGFYAVSAVGGIVSSAGAVASAATLADRGALSPDVAGIGAVIASATSVLVAIPLAMRLAPGTEIARRLTWSSVAIVVAGLLSALLVVLFAPGFRS